VSREKNKAKLTEKDFKIVKALIGNRKTREIKELTGWSNSTIYIISRFDTHQEYCDYNTNRLGGQKTANGSKPSAVEENTEIVTVLRDLVNVNKELVNQVRGLREAWLSKPVPSA